MGALLGLAMVFAAGLAAVAWSARARRRARCAVASEQRPQIDWHATHRSKVEAVVAQLKRLFERLPLSSDADLERRRAAWEEFAQGCISAYYNAGDDE